MLAVRLLPIGRRPALPALLILAITGCTPGEPEVIKSGNGRFQLTVPAGWREDPALHDTAGLRASDRGQEMYVIIISESKQDFTDDMTLEGFTTMSRESVMKLVSDPQASPPATVTVAETYPGMQYGIHGRIENVRVAYLVTNVETPKDFHQIIAWTRGSRIAQNETKLQELVNTFRVND